MEEFITILKNETAEIVEKKSKFIANLFHVESVEEAENRIKDIKKKYHDARHNCIAYRVAENGQIIEKSSDDGEPSGSYCCYQIFWRNFIGYRRISKSIFRSDSAGDRKKYQSHKSYRERDDY